MKKFNQPPANRTDRRDTAGLFSRGGVLCRRAFFCVALLAAGCAGIRGDDGQFEPSGEAVCRSLDSAFAASGWREAMDLSGKVKLDVKQYRVQGRFRASFDGDGNFTFEFTGTMALGGHHEDVVVSFQEGRLYVLDRERGRFYEGEETNQLVQEGLGMDWELVQLVQLVTAWPPPCHRLSRVVVEQRGDNGGRVKGLVDGKSFQADFENGKIVKSSWPVISSGREEDRLSLSYNWRDKSPGQPQPKELVAFLEGRRWRMILEVN